MSPTIHQSTILLQRNATGLGQIGGSHTHWASKHETVQAPTVVLDGKKEHKKVSMYISPKAQCIPPKHAHTSIMKVPSSLCLPPLFPYGGNVASMIDLISQAFYIFLIVLQLWLICKHRMPAGAVSPSWFSCAVFVEKLLEAWRLDVDIL